ncbi:MAG: MCP four helix bundle domain-containing protein [Deltaproteobacteria bacterium]|nr:MCP four helix bundle domain-containing protein [Deltaproteobacteria bacterium]
MRIALSDRRRLLLSFGLIIGLFALTGALTLYSLFVLGTLTETIYQHPLVVSNAALRSAVQVTKMHRGMKEVVLSDAPESRHEALVRVTENEKRVYTQLDLVRSNILGKEGKALERKTRALLKAWKPIRDKVVRLKEAGHTAQAIYMTQNRSAEHVAKLENKMMALTAYTRQNAADLRAQTLRHQRHFQVLIIVISSFAILFSVLIALLATRRVTAVHTALQTESNRLEKALAEIKTLRGIIPVCSNCRKIRDDEGVWKAMEEYLHEHSDASFSHGICPKCLKDFYPDIADEVNRRLESNREKH